MTNLTGSFGRITVLPHLSAEMLLIIARTSSRQLSSQHLLCNVISQFPSQIIFNFAFRIKYNTMANEMQPEIILYDLACIKNICFSPVVWKIRLMLNYKGIPYKTIFLEFPDIEPTLKEL